MTVGETKWPMQPLGELVDILDSLRVPVSANERSKRPGEVPYYGASGPVGTIDKHIFDEPLLLLGEDGVQFFDSGKSKSYLIEGPAWVNNHAHVLRARPTVERKFLNYYLNHCDYRGFANGTTRLKLTQAAMRKIPVPVPPMDVQRSIIDVLEDHLSRLESAHAELVRLDQRAQLFVRSSLTAGLRGQLLEDDLSEGGGHDLLGDAGQLATVSNDRTWKTPETWAWTRIGELFEVNIGATPSRGDASHWDGDLPWVSSGEVAFGRISNTRERITRTAAGNPATRIHPPGTVMLAMIGEGKTRGQAAVLDIEAAHNQNCASIRVSATEVLPEFVFGYFEERYLETRRGGAGGQQPALNKAAIKKFAIPIPPLGTQRRLVAAWAEAKEAASRLAADLDVAGRRSDALRRSLLAAAFSGRLTCEAEEVSDAEEMIGT